MERAAISVIIPTDCRTARAASLRRAIRSVTSQEGVDVEVIVVVNGPNYDRDMMAELQANANVRVEYLRQAGLPAAHRHGRAAVRTPYFSFLDDDDQYLPGSLHLRAAIMLSDPAVDVVATNGLAGPNGDVPYIDQTRGIDTDPLAALLRGNWLGSCGALFRSTSVTEEFFDGRTRYYEWTMVAFRLARAGLRIRFLDVPTYRMNETENSLSRSDAYFQAEPAFLASLLDLELAPRYRRAIRRKYLGSLHGLAERSARNGEVPAAWAYHMRSMGGLLGLKYIIFTRHLVRPTFRWLGSRLVGRGGVSEGRILA